MSEDEPLLRAYAEQRCEAAFAKLVSRHIDLVYSVAARGVGGDSHLAQDVVQTVFTDLSRKAGRLPAGVVLAGWLCRHTFFVASSLVRAGDGDEQLCVDSRAGWNGSPVGRDHPRGSRHQQWHRLVLVENYGVGKNQICNHDFDRGPSDRRQYGLCRPT